MRRNRGLKFEIEQLFKFSGETSAKDVHQAADSVGMKWDNNVKFMKFSKRVTGKSHIDDMTSNEKDQLIRSITNV